VDPETDPEGFGGEVVFTLDDGRKVEIFGWGHDWWGIGARNVT
jgi:hypothetical protein